ncbi:hypothetical protein P7C70_g4361, partial [Phenoliferia sp. Uapishka_3]
MSSPPTYDHDDSKSLPEKEDASMFSHTTAAAGPSSGHHAVDSGGPPEVLNVYKSAGFFSNDDVITGVDKNIVLLVLWKDVSKVAELKSTLELRRRYYLTFPHKRNHFSLRRGGKDGELVCDITTGTLATEFGLKMGNGWSTHMRWPAMLNGNFDFIAHDGMTYRWKSPSRVSMQFISELRSSTDMSDVVATWRRTAMSSKKGGQLILSQLYAGEIELILSTALSVEGGPAFS